MACGAYHSVALVRSLPAKHYNPQGAPESSERGRSPSFFVGEREELSAVDGGHYCPLGVELTEGGPGGEVDMDNFLQRYFCQLVFVRFFFSNLCCLHFFSFAVPDSSEWKRSKAEAASWREVSGQQPRLRSRVTSGFSRRQNKH